MKPCYGLTYSLICLHMGRERESGLSAISYKDTNQVRLEPCTSDLISPELPPHRPHPQTQLYWELGFLHIEFWGSTIQSIALGFSNILRYEIYCF